MSRSTKKPIITDQQHHKNANKAKRRANKSVRIAKDISNGSAFKKEHCSWNICDYKSYCAHLKKAYRK